jgi:hypothetical protein
MVHGLPHSVNVVHKAPADIGGADSTCSPRHVPMLLVSRLGVAAVIMWCAVRSAMRNTPTGIVDRLTTPGTFHTCIRVIQVPRRTPPNLSVGAAR